MNLKYYFCIDFLSNETFYICSLYLLELMKNIEKYLICKKSRQLFFFDAHKFLSANVEYIYLQTLTYYLHTCSWMCYFFFQYLWKKQHIFAKPAGAQPPVTPADIKNCVKNFNFTIIKCKIICWYTKNVLQDVDGISLGTLYKCFHAFL